MINKKPKVLYHSSPNRDINVFEPRKEKVRDPEEGPVVFATPDKALAAAFLIRTDGSWVKIGRFTDNGVITNWHLVTNNKRKFLKNDIGGVIYHLPSKTFNNDSDKGMGSMEWVSRLSVEPIKKEVFESGLEAMEELGVDVYFVSKRIFRKIDKAEDQGREIISNLKREI